MKELSEVAQLSLPSDDAAEADSGLNTETTNQYVWVSQRSAAWMMYYSSVLFLTNLRLHLSASVTPINIRSYTSLAANCHFLQLTLIVHQHAMSVHPSHCGIVAK